MTEVREGRKRGAEERPRALRRFVVRVVPICGIVLSAACLPAEGAPAGSAPSQSGDQTGETISQTWVGTGPGEKLFWPEGRPSGSIRKLRAELAVIQRHDSADMLSRAASLQAAILIQLGEDRNTTEMLAAGNEALATYEKLIRLEPDIERHRRARAVVRYLVAATHHQTGETTKALPLVRQSIAEEEMLLRKSPEDWLLNGTLSHAYLELGALLKNTEPESAAEALTSSVATLERLSSRSPEEPWLWWKLGEVQGLLSVVLADLGQTDRALVAAEAAVSRYLRLAFRFPEEISYQENLGYGFLQVADLHLRDNNTTAAETDLTSAYIALDAIAGKSTLGARGAASALDQLTDVLSDLRQFQKAADTGTTAIALRKQLLARTPEDPTALSELGYTQRVAADAFYAAGRFDEALEAARAELEILPRVQQAWPDSEYPQEATAYLQGQIREYLGIGGRFQESLATSRKALELFSRLAGQTPDRHDLQLDHLRSGIALLNALSNTGQTSEALQVLRRIRTATQDAVQKWGTEPEWRAEQAYLAEAAAILQDSSGNTTAALEQSREALSLVEGLIRETTDSALLEYQQEQLASVLTTLGAIQAKSIGSDREGGARTLRRAVALANELFTREPSTWWRQDLLADAHLELGIALRRSEPEAARQAFERALSLSESVPYRSTSEARIVRALSLLHLGRVEEARPIAQELMTGGWRHPAHLKVFRNHGIPPSR